MIRYLFLILTLFSLSAAAQQPTGVPTKIGSNVAVTGFLTVDKAILIKANDTLTKYSMPAIVYRTADSCFYYWNMVKFQKLGSGASGSETDTSHLSARIDEKLDKEDTSHLSDRINALFSNKLNQSDTAAMLVVYLRKGDTTGMLIPYMRKGDSLAAYITPYQADTLRNGLLEAIANIPIDTSRVTFETVADMQAYTGIARYAFVEDKFDGGAFYLSDTGEADDSLVYEGATGFWIRELDFYVFDTSPTGDLAVTDSVIIQHGDQYGHYSVKNLLFSTGSYTDPSWLTLSISKITHLLDSLGKKQDTISGTGVPTFTGRTYTFEEYIPSSHVVAAITGTDISHWNDAYSWGDHAGLYPTLSRYDSLLTAVGEIVSEGGATKFADLLDVDTSGLADGYVSRWVAANSKWEPIPVVTVDLDGISVNDYPGWDGTKFVKKTPDWLTASTGVPASRTITINGTTYDLSANRSFTVSGGEGGATYFSDLLDIRWDNLKNWDLPVYSEDSAKWLNRPMIRADLSGIIGGDLLAYDDDDSTFKPFTLPAFLTENQTITITGDATGGGKTNIELTIGTHKILNDMLAGNIDTSKINGLHNELAARQALNSYLTQISGLSPTTGDILRYGSGGWGNITTAAFKTALGLTKDDVGLSNVVNVNTTNANNITSGTLAASRLSTSGVTAGSYTLVNLTVDAYGRTTAVSNGSLSALTFGSGLTGTSYNGSTAVTIGLDNTVVALLSGSQTFTGNKTFSGSVLVPAPDASDSTSSAASTKWVKQLLAAYSPGGPSSYTFSSPLSESSGTVSIANAAANGSTKGAATFNASDFNDNGSGVISFDYTNAQLATSSQNGLLKASDWSDFNSKQPALSGTGFVRVASGVVYYENKTFMETSHVANSITSTNINNWNNAYSWGNHASVGYSTASNSQTFTNKTWHGAVISPGYGGLGASNLTGYLYANGSGAATASPTIPYSAISGFTTSNITEGSKLFYTNDRALATTLTNIPEQEESITTYVFKGRTIEQAIFTLDSALFTEREWLWNSKAEVDSPTFTGTPKAPTPPVYDSSTRVATTAYVDRALSGYVDSGVYDVDTSETGEYLWFPSTLELPFGAATVSQITYRKIGESVTITGNITLETGDTGAGAYMYIPLPPAYPYSVLEGISGIGSGQAGVSNIYATEVQAISGVDHFVLNFDVSSVPSTFAFSITYNIAYP